MGLSKDVFRCKIITPTFCYGADGDTPDLRAPSIKGALRFWWRALHPNLELSEMKEKETMLFGGVEENGARKSSFSLQVVNIKKKEHTIQALPHKQSFTKKAIMPDSTFDILIKPASESISNLLKFTSIVGSFGARSRRGFGCFQIESINDVTWDLKLEIESIYSLIKTINPKIEIGKQYNREYPYLKKVMIGKSNSSYDDLLKKIGLASHQYNTPYTGTTNENYIKSKRYSSPVYVSIWKQGNDYYPIITILKRTIKDIDGEEDKKQKFIKEILEVNNV
jgi:CRISPR-associated protein Cmr1